MTDTDWLRGQTLYADALDMAFGRCIDRAGDQMSGEFILAMDPQMPMDAATKQYVDNRILGAPPPSIISVIISDVEPIGVAAGALWWQSSTGLLYVYYTDANSSQWVNITAAASIGAGAAGTVPLMDGVGAVGTTYLYARQDHVHPTDTSRLGAGTVAGGDLSGTYPNPTLATTGVVAGSYTNTNLTVDAKGRITAAANGVAGSSGATITVSDTPPAITNGGMWFDSAGGQLYIGYNDGTSSQWVVANSALVSAPLTYAQLPPTAQQMPMAFSFVGKPTSIMTVNVPIAFPITVPNGLVGTVVYDMTRATAPAVFTVNKISGGTLTTIGSVTITSMTNTSCTLSGSGGSLGVGDVLQVVAPGSQDATLADLGITLLTLRG